MGDIETEARIALRTKAVEELADEYHLAACLALLRPGERGYTAAVDAAALTRIGRQIAALAVARCNRGLSPRQERKREGLAAKVKMIAGWYGLTAETHGDPRGYTVKLYGEDLPNNSFGDGFGVA